MHKYLSLFRPGACCLLKPPLGASLKAGFKTADPKHINKSGQTLARKNEIRGGLRATRVCAKLVLETAILPKSIAFCGLPCLSPKSLGILLLKKTFLREKVTNSANHGQKHSNCHGFYSYTSSFSYIPCTLYANLSYAALGEIYQSLARVRRKKSVELQRPRGEAGRGGGEVRIQSHRFRPCHRCITD